MAAASDTSKMKFTRIPKLFIFAALISVFSAGAAFGQSKTQDQILKRETQWEQAVIKADSVALGEIFSDDLTYTHSSGNTDTKSEYIGNLKSGKLKYTAILRESPKVREYGSSAIYTCRAKMSVLSNGQALSFEGIIIHVWVKTGGKWRLAAHQSTRTAQ